MTRAGLVQAARAAGAVSQPEARDRKTTRLWAAVLAEIPLFAHVPARHVAQDRGAAARSSRFEPGSQIVRAGEPETRSTSSSTARARSFAGAGCPRVPIRPAPTSARWR